MPKRMPGGKCMKDVTSNCMLAWQEQNVPAPIYMYFQVCVDIWRGRKKAGKVFQQVKDYQKRGKMGNGWCEEGERGVGKGGEVGGNERRRMERKKMDRYDWRGSNWESRKHTEKRRKRRVCSKRDMETREKGNTGKAGKGKKEDRRGAVASLFLFLTSCSQSVGQIPLLEHRQPHTHILFFFLFTHTNPPLHTLTLTKIHILSVLLTHTHSLFLTQNPWLNTHTHSLLFHTTHTQSNYSSQGEKKSTKAILWEDGRRKKEWTIFLLSPHSHFYHSLSPISSFPLFSGFSPPPQ